MIDRDLLIQVHDLGSLVSLLDTDERDGGLGWPVDADQPSTEEPEIAEGVKGDERDR